MTKKSNTIPVFKIISKRQSQRKTFHIHQIFRFCINDKIKYMLKNVLNQ